MRIKFIIAIVVSFIAISVVPVSCGNADAEKRLYVHKDLSEQMDALAIYQGSIGEEIRRGKTQDALWLVDGMDSVLHMICKDLNEHHNLLEPFDYYYKHKLQEPVGLLRNAIESGDSAAADKNYRILVKKCNSCHNEHGVEERAHY